MIFKLAMHGSFKNTAGYTWINPNKLDVRRIESIIHSLSNKRSDGRDIGGGDILGAYFIDTDEDLFYAFRYIDGGTDALGRAGVVITNCAVARYSDVCRKDIRKLFDALSFNELPANGEINVPDSFEFGIASALHEGALNGNEVDSVFRLPAAVDRNVIVQFELKSQGNTASVRYLSPAPRKPMKPEALRIASRPAKQEIPATVAEKPMVQDTKSRIGWNRFPYQMIIPGALVFALIVFAVSTMKEHDARQQNVNSVLETAQKDGSATGQNKISVLSFLEKNPGKKHIKSVCIVADEDYSWYEKDSKRRLNQLRSEEYILGNNTITFSNDPRESSVVFYPFVPVRPADVLQEDPRKHKLCFVPDKFQKTFMNKKTDADLQGAYSLRKNGEDHSALTLSIFGECVELEFDSSIPNMSFSAGTDDFLQNILSSANPTILFCFKDMSGPTEKIPGTSLPPAQESEVPINE